ncbi:MFS transporter [Streptomyces sp. SKN60]|uniref:MFS transporter n=1 Tax=Streptomyces sp. SKN60 TaxID=2855506 RepID=UPI002247666E|nr:MFS transporter [Streptomyces sp. SKN60]MCX2182269.1 MFS transporter [Streptomyces sp. SKN60]
MNSVASRLKRWPFVPGQAKFRKLWAAQSVSLMGSQVSLVAFPLAAIYLLDADTDEVGLIAAAERLPFLVFGLLAGVLVDRWRHRKVLITADWVRAGAMALVPLFAWMNHLSIALMCVVVFVVGVATVFFDIAHQSILTSVVEEDDLLEANRLLEGSRAVSEFAGPGIAALILKLMAASYAIAVNAATFAFSALFLHAMGKVDSEPEKTGERTSIRSDLVAGLAFIRRTSFLRWNALIGATWNLLLNALMAVFFVFLARDLKLSPSVIAMVVLAGSVGGLVGIAVMGRINKMVGLGPGIAVATGTSAVGGLVMALAGGSSTQAAITVAVAYLVMNSSYPLFDVNVISIRQTITPQNLMSRTTAAMRTIVWGTLPIGSAIGGFMGVNLGTRTSITVLGVLLLLPAVFTLISPIRKIRQISDIDVPGRTADADADSADSAAAAVTDTDPDSDNAALATKR